MYNKFIENCKNNTTTEIYVETHHIIPKYMGGLDSDDNLIRLSYRQHILAHLLLFRKYNNPEDKWAYLLMKRLTCDRKQAICQMIVEKNKKSGHIEKLAKHNRDTGWMNLIKTEESLKKGGKASGKIAKESGQIYEIRTTESCKRGGITQGNKHKESGFVQQISKYKGTYVLIMPNGKEFLHAFQAAEYMNLSKSIISSRCKQGNLGFSRRPKTKEEYGMYGVLSSECD